MNNHERGNNGTGYDSRRHVIDGSGNPVSFRVRVTDTSAGLRALEAQPDVVTHATIRGTELVFIPRSQEDLGEVSRVLAAAEVGCWR